jgi:hypothetical protein
VARSAASSAREAQRFGGHEKQNKSPPDNGRSAGADVEALAGKENDYVEDDADCRHMQNKRCGGRSTQVDIAC